MQTYTNIWCQFISIKSDSNPVLIHLAFVVKLLKPEAFPDVERTMELLPNYP